MPKVPEISADTLKQRIDAGEQLIILDVRTLEERTRGSIGGSISVPMEQIMQYLTNAHHTRDDEYIIYCFSGARSVYVVQALQKAGYTRATNLKNGILEWRAKGYPVE